VRSEDARDDLDPRLNLLFASERFVRLIFPGFQRAAID